MHPAIHVAFAHEEVSGSRRATLLSHDQRNIGSRDDAANIARARDLETQADETSFGDKYPPGLCYGNNVGHKVPRLGVIIGAFVASNPVGWATAGMAVAAGAQQVGSLKDEMCDTIKDANGQSINKKYPINELGSCEDDIGSLLKTAYTMRNDGSRSVDENDTQKIAVTEAQLQKFLRQFKDKLPDGQGENLRTLLDEFVAATNTRNQNILTYNNAVISLYQQIKNKTLVQKQTERLRSELLKQNQGLPSIVGYYQRLRNDSRISILRALKQIQLALAAVQC
ncbi:hypothetical protein NM208_g17020 [Fusarium decemcellulare]|uniref:Uncharacterized protein n=1 Tax=Fusarium decemcellulare TaxID=57161 RepID=A0ACC1R8K5_9HYPO|nr:hypothetical protein NM208_g17020 [Fusarium decemcellulare]